MALRTSVILSILAVVTAVLWTMARLAAAQIPAADPAAQLQLHHLLDEPPLGAIPVRPAEA